MADISDFSDHAPGSLNALAVGSVFPELIGSGHPVFSCLNASSAVIAGLFALEHIRGLCAGFIRHSDKSIGIIRHRVRAQHVAVEGLFPAAGLEQQ